MLETLPMWSNVQPQLQPHPLRKKISEQGNTRKASLPTASFAVRLRHQESCFERSPREPKALHAHIVRAQWSATQFISIEVGSGHHGEHVVARNIFPVKTQRDDGDLSTVSLTTLPLGRRRNMRPVKVRLVKQKMAST